MAYTFNKIKSIVADHKIKPKEIWKHEPKLLKKGKKFRKKNGFYQFDSWEFCSQLCCWALPRLTYLRDHHSGVSAKYLLDCIDITKPTDNELEKAEMAFMADLNKVIDAMAKYLDGNVLDNDKEIQEAFELFGRILTCLWD